MSQNDYRDKVEEHRQSIGDDLNETNPGRATRSRSSRHDQGKNNNKNNNKLITILGCIFVLIPIAILIYFSVLPDPSNNSKIVEDTTQSNVNVQTNNNSDTKAAADDEKSEEDDVKAAKEKEEKAAAAAEKAAKEKEAKEKAATEKVTKEKEAKVAAEKAAAEKAAKEKAEKAAAEKAAKEKAEKAAAEKAAKEKEAASKATSSPNTASAAYRASIQKGYLHNVSAGDTVQSISIKYYGSTSRASEIRQLNGLSSDNVTPGTKIALPLK